MTIDVTDEAKAKRTASLEKARAARSANAARRREEKAQEPPSRQMDDAEVREKRAKLLQELADLPQEPSPTGAAPGTLYKDGLGYDKVPWTPAVLRDYCNREVVVDGVPFGWKTIIGVKEHPTVSWNGIVYWLFAEQENKVPSVHFAVYMQMLEDRRREAAKWAAPANPPTFDGYMSPPHQFSTTGPLEPRGE